MRLNDLLDRIDAVAGPRRLSDQQVSLMAGSKDVLRNWRRAAAKGKELHPRLETIAEMAHGLGVPLHVLTGSDAAPDAAAAQAFHEGAATYHLQPYPVAAEDPQASLRAIFGPRALTPATYQVGEPLPAFQLEPGDILVCDMARLPNPGELALVNRFDEGLDNQATEVRRYLPPFLLSGSCAARPDIIRIDEPGVAVRFPVIGSIRGLGD
jgi:hypothetical protein